MHQIMIGFIVSFRRIWSAPCVANIVISENIAEGMPPTDTGLLVWLNQKQNIRNVIKSWNCFMGLECSLLYSHEPISGHYPEPNEFGQHVPIISSFSKIHFYNTGPSTSGFSFQTSVYAYLCHAYYMLSPSSSNMWQGVKVTKLLIRGFLRPPNISSLLGPNVISTLHSNSIILCSFFNVWDKFHIYKTMYR